ncbi:MAG: hypothetical protein M1818_008521, partial [Claussenomyces sp. TS43310]
MPQPTLPPTPNSSTDIKPRDAPPVGFSQMSFELPPPAIVNLDSRPTSAEYGSLSASYHSTSPKSVPPSNSRRRSSTTVAAPQAKPASNFGLPPPPSRSRKIIQMKPKGQRDGSSGTSKDTAGNVAAGKPPPKKKQPSATSVAGRKMARKTAHSLIERRRRSKMNEEFGVLKDMIPACTGEMHKLAILQASIDYVRYLEDCVAKLKTQDNHSTPTPGSPGFPRPPRPRKSWEYNGSGEGQYKDEADEDDEDVSMDVLEAASPVRAATVALPQSHESSVSPVMLAQDSRYRQSSYNSASNADVRNYSYSTSATTSPTFRPQVHDYAASITSRSSPAISPALRAQTNSDRDLDQEATAALLMLNNDRRGT